MGQSQIQPVPFNVSQDTSASELGGAAPVVVNAIMDKAGAVRRRPGISYDNDFDGAVGTGAIIGMVVWNDWLVYVDANRMIYAIKPGSTQVDLSDATDPSTMLAGSGRPVFVAGRTMLVIAGGQQMQKWAGTGLSARLDNTGYTGLGGTGEPPDATFICAIAQRLIAQQAGDSGNIWWSGNLERYEDWDFYASDDAGSIQASAKPDPIQATFDNTNEVFCFGNQTLQVFVPSALTIDAVDPTNVTSFAPNRTQNIGTIAPYSVVPVDDMFVMIDRLRRAIITDGRTYQDVSQPVASRLLELTIEDSWGFRLKFGRFDAIVWIFPTDGYGLFYDNQLGNWGEWRYSETDPVGIGVAFASSITSAFNWSERGVFLVGLSNGYIAKLDDTVNTDLGDPINIEVVSGFVDHGSMSQKLCRTLMLKFKRTTAKLAKPSAVGLTASGFVRLWYRDDEGPWEHIRDIELSDGPSPCEQIRSLGVYRTRQWKVQYTGADEIQLVSAQEEFEILGA